MLGAPSWRWLGVGKASPLTPLSSGFEICKEEGSGQRRPPAGASPTGVCKSVQLPLEALAPSGKGGSKNAL